MWDLDVVPTRRHFVSPDRIEDRFDVVIVGAGLSGLSAAYHISERDTNLNVAVIEKRGPVGDKCEDCVDFCSENDYFLIELLERLEIPKHVRRPEGRSIAAFGPSERLLYSDETVPVYGSWIDRVLIEYFFAKVEKLVKSLSFLMPNAIPEAKDLDLVSLEQYINDSYLTNTARSYLKVMFETNCGVSASDISALFYLIYCRSTYGIVHQFTNDPKGLTGYVIHGGRGVICRELVSHTDVKFFNNEKVVEIKRTSENSFVRTTKRLFKCHSVIVALPPNAVLEINFVPSLPYERIELLENMVCGTFNTTIITYNKDDLRSNNLSGDFVCDGRSVRRCVNVTSKSDAFYVHLFSWTSTAKILEQLAEYFGDVPRMRSIVHWEDNHISRAIWYPKIGAMMNFGVLRRPINRLFWAGSELTTVAYGQLEGSVQSGYTAGVELLYDYKPQSLTMRDIYLLKKLRPPTTVFKDKFMNKLLQEYLTYLGYVTPPIIASLAFYLYRRRRS